MYGLNRLTAAGHVFRFGGRTWRLAPLVLADYGEIENLILAGRQDPLAEIGRRLASRPEAERREELRRVLDQLGGFGRVTLAELDRWWQTREALDYRLWLMLRSGQPGTTLEEAAELIRQLDAAGRVELRRRMADCHGWPDMLPGASAGLAGDEEEVPLAWHRWAAELSRTYGWTPQEIGRLTLAQMCLFLGRAGSSTARQRVSPAEGAALCRRRREEREQWIARMLEQTAEGRDLSDQGGLGSLAAWEGLCSVGDAVAPRGVFSGVARGSLPTRTGAVVPSAGLAPCRDFACGRELGPCRGSARGRDRAPSRDLARSAAGENHQVEQIRIAREQLLEQKKTNRHLAARHDSLAAVFEA